MLWKRVPNRRVVVASRDWVTRGAVDETLRAEGYDVLLATDVQRTLALVDALAPHLILADADLTGGGAQVVIDHVRGADRPAPVGVFTDHTRVDAERISADMGAHSWLNRPLDLDQVVRVAAALVPAASEA